MLAIGELREFKFVVLCSNITRCCLIVLLGVLVLLINVVIKLVNLCAVEDVGLAGCVQIGIRPDVVLPRPIAFSVLGSLNLKPAANLVFRCHHKSFAAN